MLARYVTRGMGQKLEHNIGGQNNAPFCPPILSQTSHKQ